MNALKQIGLATVLENLRTSRLAQAQGGGCQCILPGWEPDRCTDNCPDGQPARLGFPFYREWHGRRVAAECTIRPVQEPFVL